jgi:ectoine hydroxylase-related dioxygenase (phytanoyl-CoA dioxygenase family)
VPDELRSILERDGVVMVPALLDPEWCERLRSAIETTRRSPSFHYGVLSPADRPRVDSDLFRWFDDDTIAELTTESPLVRLAADLLGSDDVVLVEDQWFCSEPGATTPSPWHQDDPYYNLDRPFLTVWITLDDIDFEAALRVVPGSHLGPIYAPVEFSAGEATIGASALEPVPDVEADAERFPILTWTLSAGDAVAFDSRLLHATGSGAIEGRPFRRISTRWALPTTRYLDRGTQAASFWTVLQHGLSTGDPLACDVFPLRRAASSAG